MGVQSEQIKLYDVRSFDKGPFSTFKYPIETGCDWTGIKFSLDGKLMMLTTNGAVIRCLGEVSTSSSSYSPPGLLMPTRESHSSLWQVTKTTR